MCDNSKTKKNVRRSSGFPRTTSTRGTEDYVHSRDRRPSSERCVPPSLVGVPGRPSVFPRPSLSNPRHPVEPPPGQSRGSRGREEGFGRPLLRLLRTPSPSSTLRMLQSLSRDFGSIKSLLPRSHREPFPFKREPPLVGRKYIRPIILLPTFLNPHFQSPYSHSPSTTDPCSCASQR